VDKILVVIVSDSNVDSEYDEDHGDVDVINSDVIVIGIGSDSDSDGDSEYDEDHVDVDENRIMIESESNVDVDHEVSKDNGQMIDEDKADMNNVRKDVQEKPETRDVVNNINPEG
jgi:hypothetical protein